MVTSALLKSVELWYFTCWFCYFTFSFILLVFHFDFVGLKLLIVYLILNKDIRCNTKYPCKIRITLEGKNYLIY